MYTLEGLLLYVIVSHAFLDPTFEFLSNFHFWGVSFKDMNGFQYSKSTTGNIHPWYSPGTYYIV